eukprot:256524_1
MLLDSDDNAEIESINILLDNNNDDDSDYNNDDSDYNNAMFDMNDLSDNDDNDDILDQLDTVNDLGKKLQDNVDAYEEPTDSPCDMFHTAYKDLLKEPIGLMFPGSRYFPYKNLLHALLHGLYRNESYSGKMSRELMNQIIDIFWAIDQCGWYDKHLDVKDELPKSAQWLTQYDKSAVYFTWNEKKLFVHQKKPKVVIKSKSNNDANDDERKSRPRVYKKKIEVEIIEDNSIDITKYKHEIDRHQYDLGYYDEYCRKPFTFRFFSPVKYLAWNALLPDWMEMLDLNFEYRPERVQSINHTEFMRNNILYEYENLMIPPLANGTRIIKFGFIFDDTNKIFYYVKNIKYEIRK